MNIILAKSFKRELKTLGKKYRSLPTDVIKLVEELKQTPQLGTPLGNNLYKIRLNLSDKNQVLSSA